MESFATFVSTVPSTIFGHLYRLLLDVSVPVLFVFVVLTRTETAKNIVIFSGKYSNQRHLE